MFPVFSAAEKIESVFFVFSAAEKIESVFFVFSAAEKRSIRVARVFRGPKRSATSVAQI
jgi:hypothetical protein